MDLHEDGCFSLDIYNTQGAARASSEQPVKPFSAKLDSDVAYDGIIAEVPVKPSSLYVRVGKQTGGCEGMQQLLSYQCHAASWFVRASTLQVRNMVKHFKTAKGVFKAVDGVDVDIEPSSIVALLGPSGSGKTTLLRLIAGLEMPTGGRILFDDFDATYTPVQDRKIGFVFQSYALFNHKTVAENIKFGLEVSEPWALALAVLHSLWFCIELQL
jgi:ABC-type glutathione transport system ATPase component